MASTVHSAAHIDPNAKLGDRVTVGAFTIIGRDVEIGEGTEIGSHVVIEGPTSIGEENVISPFVSLGQGPQDRKYGGEPTELVINYFPALPVVLRFHDVSWHYDAEIAPVSWFQADDGDFSYGVRLGGGIGVAALRTRGFLPWAGLAIGYEHYFESGGRPEAHFIRGGLRVGFMLDP